MTSMSAGSRNGAPSWTAAEIDYLARSARAAPSVHDTRPSALVFGGHTVDLHETSERALIADDPSGRDRRISCGAALTNLELAVRALGWSAAVARYPDRGQQDLIGRIRAMWPQAATDDELAWAAAMPHRHSHRRRFQPTRVAEPDIGRLIRAAGPLVTVHRIIGTDQTTALAELVDYAGRVLRDDQAFQRELVGWTVRDGHLGPFGLRLGIRFAALNRAPLSVAGPVHDGTPLPESHVLAERIGRETILVLTTVGDSAADHVRAGQALERLWLAAVSRGLAASILTQPLQLSEVRDRLRRHLGLSGQPHLLIRVGFPQPTPNIEQDAHQAADEPGRGVGRTASEDRLSSTAPGRAST